MISPLKAMGMEPSREHTNNQDGSSTVRVTPPSFVNAGSGATVILKKDQFERYLKWLNGSTPIQEVLPDLHYNQREILMSGIGPEAWDEMFGEKDE